MLVLIDVVLSSRSTYMYGTFFFFQAEDGIRDLVRSRGLGDVYKRQWQPGESILDVLARYFPSETDAVGNLTTIWTPEYLSLIHI